MLQYETKSNSLYPVILLIIIAALTRFIPHPFNFTAIGAIALFSGANFRDKRLAYLLPFAVMLITDLIIGFHFSLIPVYGSFAIAVFIGTMISKNQNVVSIGIGSIISSVIFFLITNLPFWYLDLKLYPMTISGTIESYTMALPFFRNQLIGDLFYSALLFGIFHMMISSKSDYQNAYIKNKK
jgi:hypothetical protein